MSQILKIKSLLTDTESSIKPALKGSSTKYLGSSDGSKRSKFVYAREKVRNAYVVRHATSALSRLLN